MFKEVAEKLFNGAVSICFGWTGKAAHRRSLASQGAAASSVSYLVMSRRPPLDEFRVGADCQLVPPNGN